MERQSPDVSEPRAPDKPDEDSQADDNSQSRAPDKPDDDSQSDDDREPDDDSHPDDDREPLEVDLEPPRERPIKPRLPIKSVHEDEFEPVPHKTWKGTSEPDDDRQADDNSQSRAHDKPDDDREPVPPKKHWRVPSEPRKPRIDIGRQDWEGREDWEVDIESCRRSKRSIEKIKTEKPVAILHPVPPAPPPPNPPV